MRCAEGMQAARHSALAAPPAAEAEGPQQDQCHYLSHERVNSAWLPNLKLLLCCAEGMQAAWHSALAAPPAAEAEQGH